MSSSLVPASYRTRSLLSINCFRSGWGIGQHAWPFLALTTHQHSKDVTDSDSVTWPSRVSKDVTTSTSVGTIQVTVWRSKLKP